MLCEGVKLNQRFGAKPNGLVRSKDNFCWNAERYFTERGDEPTFCGNRASVQ